MRTLHIAVLTTTLLALAGCHTLGIEKKRVDYKTAAASSSVPSLEVPPDLTTPSAEDRYAIPEGNGESVESYSDYTRGGGSRPAHVVSSVLPPVKGVHLEHDATQHWLEVDGPAESVWPQVKEFWLQNGFSLKTDNPQAGIMETNWLENRANIPEGGLRSLLGKVLKDVYDSGLRDRYLTRMERSKDGQHTEIYITHYGMQEVMVGSEKDSSKWEPRPRDPELEATMLQMLMAKLGGNAEAQAGGGEVAITGARPVLQRLSDGSTAIMLAEPFDRTWREVELGLDQAGLAVEDKDRAGGVLYLRAAQKQEKGVLESLEFWKSDKAKPARMQVVVRASGAGSLITVSTEGGETNSDTQHVVDVLYRSMAAQTAGPVATARALPTAPPKLQQAADGNNTILLSESADLCWNDVQSALDHGGMTPVDSDRPAGKLYLPAADRDQEGSWFNRLEFWKSGSSIKMARPEVVIRPVENGCEVSANDGNGKTNEATQAIIDTLYKNLNK